MALLLTGYLLQILALCEYRGVLENRQDPGRKPPPITARSIVSAYLGRCGRRFCLHRKRYQGEAYGIEYMVSPDIIVTDKEENPVAVVKAALTGSPVRMHYFTRLMLEAYAVIKAEEARSLILAVLSAREPSSLLRGVAYLLDEWGLGPYIGEGFKISTRYYDEHEAHRIISRAAGVLRGEVSPRPRPGAACRYCPYRESCPVLG